MTNENLDAVETEIAETKKENLPKKPKKELSQKDLLLMILTHARSAKALFKDLTLEEAEIATAKVNEALAYRKQIEEKRTAKQREQQAKIEKYLEMLEQDGVNPEELAEFLGKAGKPRTRKQAKAKYQFTDEKGEVRQWTGQGRMPLPLKNALESGKALDDFLIPQTEVETTDTE